MGYYAKRFFGQQQGIVTDGLKLWLDASNPASYPGSGTTWYDLSGNGNNGIMIGGVTPLSNAMQFDGVNDRVDNRTATNMPKGTKPRTVSIWCNTMKLPVDSALFSLIAVGNNTSGKLFSLSIALGKYFLWGSTVNYESSYAPTLGQWENITVIYNGTFTKIYKNGVPDIGANITLNTTNSNLYYIGGFTSYATPYNGQINDAFIYNRVLTTDEILQNYNVTKSKYGL